MIKVFIVDDHTVVTGGIIALLQNETNISVEGSAIDAETCLSWFKQYTADVILMDINLPGMNGVELCKIIKSQYPSVMVLALSTFNQGSYIMKMMENGASGYLLKNVSKAELVEAIDAAISGKTYLNFEVGKVLQASENRKSSIPLLTKREREVLALIAEGLTNAQIGQRLFISIDTVDTHRKNLHTKLNVKNTAMLIRSAIDNELIG